MERTQECRLGQGREGTESVGGVWESPPDGGNPHATGPYRVCDPPGWGKGVSPAPQPPRLVAEGLNVPLALCPLTPQRGGGGGEIYLRALS